MKTYTYTAIDLDGKKSKGTIETDSEKLVRQKLRERNLIPITVKATAGSVKSFGTSSYQLSNQELALITRQLSILIKSGIPLAEVFHLLSEQTESKKVKTIAIKIRQRLLEGLSLTKALNLLGSTFPPLYIATTNAGETSGKLIEIFDNLADYLETKADLHQKIKLSLLYPIILTIVSLAVIISLLIFVIPEIVIVFDDLGQQLPELTLNLIQVSDFLKNHGQFLLAGLLSIGFSIKLLLKNNDFKKSFDTYLIKLPLIGKILLNVETARFIRTLSILSNSKVETLNSLSIASEVINNRYIKAAVLSAANSVRKGSSISKALRDEKCFRPITLHLINSGESSGKLGDMLDSTASYHEKEIQQFASNFVGIFEPLLILIMGGLVLLIVLAILLPIFEMNQLIG